MSHKNKYCTITGIFALLLDKVTLLYTMMYFSLLFAFLTLASAEAAPIYCSDVQSPPASGSHDTNLSQVISLQYCIIDNCTIMKIDTGEQLDIVYTTDSLLIVTPTDGLTSMVIAKLDDELPCLKYHSTTDGILIVIEPVGGIIFSLIIMFVSLYILIVNLLFKELHTLFGKLLVLYNLCIVCTSINIIILISTNYWIIVNSQIICHSVMISFMMSDTGSELFATTLLSHLAYLMYRSYWLKPEISDKNKQLLFKYYVAYAFITLVLLFFLTITYDWRTENGRYTLLPNGHCDHIDQYAYKTLFLGEVIGVINKFIQIAMFLAYLFYFYKLKADFRDAPDSARYNRELFKIAIAMGATVGLSRLIWILVVFDPSYSFTINTSGATLLLIQQVVIMTIFMCTRKISELCKARFLRD